MSKKPLPVKKTAKAQVKKKGAFTKMAEATAHWTGTSQAFLLALSCVIIWAVTGPVFDYSDTWQLVINTGTTIMTFLMVFLIQNSQNRDTAALHLKLNELIRSLEGPHAILLDLEELSEEEIAQIHARYQQLAKEARAIVRKGGSDAHILDIKLD